MLLLLLACTPESPSTPAPSATTAPAPKKVRLALNWYPEPEFGGFYDAKLSGAYAAKGLDVEILPGGPSAPTLELLSAGNVEVALAAGDDFLLKRAKGLDAVAIFPGFQDTPVGLLTHADSGVTRFEDVAGKPGVKVAIEVGSAFQQFLWARYGWEGKVGLVNTTGALGAFAQDKDLLQQGYVTSEPCVAEAQGLAVRFLPAGPTGWNPYASLAVVRTADKDAPWVAAFREVSKAGWEAYLQDPTRANAEISKLNPDMAGAKIACVTERQKPYVTGTDGLGVMTEARWKATAEALGSVGKTVDPTGAWVP